MVLSLNFAFDQPYSSLDNEDFQGKGHRAWFKEARQVDVWSWVSHFTFLSPNFFICKMGMMFPTGQVIVRTKTKQNKKIHQVPGRCQGARGDHQLVASNTVSRTHSSRVFLPRSEETWFHLVKCGVCMLSGEGACKSDPHTLTLSLTRHLCTDLALGWHGWRFLLHEQVFWLVQADLSASGYFAFVPWGLW